MSTCCWYRPPMVLGLWIGTCLQEVLNKVEVVHVSPVACIVQGRSALWPRCSLDVGAYSLLLLPRVRLASESMWFRPKSNLGNIYSCSHYDLCELRKVCPLFRKPPCFATCRCSNSETKCPKQRVRKLLVQGLGFSILAVIERSFAATSAGGLGYHLRE
jgi:hypothetical protein